MRSVLEGMRHTDARFVTLRTDAVGFGSGKKPAGVVAVPLK